MPRQKRAAVELFFFLWTGLQGYDYLTLRWLCDTINTRKLPISHRLGARARMPATTTHGFFEGEQVFFDPLGGLEYELNAA